MACTLAVGFTSPFLTVMSAAMLDIAAGPWTVSRIGYPVQDFWIYRQTERPAFRSDCPDQGEEVDAKGGREKALSRSTELSAVLDDSSDSGRQKRPANLVDHIS